MNNTIETGNSLDHTGSFAKVEDKRVVIAAPLLIWVF